MNRIICLLSLLLLIASWKADRPNYYELSAEVFASLPELKRPVDAIKPDYLLLDAALFHAANKVRKQFSLPPFQYDPGLHKTAEAYAADMIQMNFYSHVHPYSPALATLAKRVEMHTWAFRKTAENIGQYQVIDTADEYCCRRKRDGSFEYFDCENRKLFSPYHYEGLAEYAVERWMHSPAHRHNMLDSAYTHLGSAGRIAKDSYQNCQAPFARFVQNFGVLKTEIVR
ncbi:MAG: CAP domain-containing protein [Spirosomataceae bacterium]